MSLLPEGLVLLPLAPGHRQRLTALCFFGFVCNLNKRALNAQVVGIEVFCKRNSIASFHGMWSPGGEAGGIPDAFLAPAGMPVPGHFTAMLVPGTPQKRLIHVRRSKYSQ